MVDPRPGHIQTTRENLGLPPTSSQQRKHTDWVLQDFKQEITTTRSEEPYQIVENKEKYLASIKSISPNEPNQVKETKNCDQSINKQKKIISSSITRKETKYDYKGTWKENLLLNHSNEKFGNYKEYKIKFLDSFSLGNLYKSSVKKCNIKSPRKEISLLSWADLRAFDSTYYNTYDIDANLREYESSNNFKFN